MKIKTNIHSFPVKELSNSATLYLQYVLVIYLLFPTHSVLGRKYEIMHHSKDISTTVFYSTSQKIKHLIYIFCLLFIFLDIFDLSSHYISYWKLFWQISYRKDTLLKVVPNICWTSRRSNSHIMRSIHISGSFYYLLMQFAGSNIYTHSHTYVHKYLYYASIGFTVYNHTQQYYTIV